RLFGFPANVLGGFHNMTRSRWPALVALAILAWAGSAALAADQPAKDPVQLEPLVLPKAAEIKALTTSPSTMALKGIDDPAQLVVTADLGTRLQDLTGDVQYDVADKNVCRVTSTGRVIPLANGTTEVIVKYGDKTVKVPVKAEACDVNLPINFP